MNTTKNDILISKFLRNELNGEEKELFANKMKTEPDFVEEVQLQMALYKALEEADKKELEEQVDIAIINLDKKIRFRKRKITLYAVVSLAASILLLIFIINPFGSNEMKQYIAMANDPSPLKIEKARSFRLPNQIIDSTSVFEICNEILISSVPDQKLTEKYFFNNCVLYTFFDTSDQVKILVDFDAQYQKVYYLCKDKTLYRLSVVNNVEEKKLYLLEKGNYPNILKLCPDSYRDEI